MYVTLLYDITRGSKRKAQETVAVQSNTKLKIIRASQQHNIEAVKPLNRRIFCLFVCICTVLYSTLLLCQRMLASNPGLLRLLHLQSDALIQTRLSLIHSRLSLNHSRTKSHPLSAKSHPLSDYVSSTLG